MSMTHNQRMAAIRYLWHRRVGVLLTAGLIAVSKREVQDTVSAQVIQTATDDSVIDPEVEGVSSQLQFDRPRFHESESDSLLSPRKRKQLRREIAVAKINTAPAAPTIT